MDPKSLSQGFPGHWPPTSVQPRREAVVNSRRETSHSNASLLSPNNPYIMVHNTGSLFAGPWYIDTQMSCTNAEASDKSFWSRRHSRSQGCSCPIGELALGFTLQWFPFSPTTALLPTLFILLCISLIFPWLVVDRHKLTVFYLKSFDVDSVQVEKAVFEK